MDVGSIPTSSNICICGRVVEGTGLIIRFPKERHWFEPSQMHKKKGCAKSKNLAQPFLFF